ncbi:ribosome biogenesis GTP-binding protein YihA/YsxC [Eubacteriales bacterium OttesenSCG-928-G02]|nr:ribosome biogenesis GTP-binding protein YihA/YsxC [Eubacteriales bacterium OttesenSCG-928-G02]
MEIQMNINNVNLHNADLGHVAGAPSQHIKEGLPQIAFSGRSNVGKSSLINSLLSRKKLARVSGEPGKTITCNYYLIDKKIFFVDLPGYGYAKRPKHDQERWRNLTQAFFEANNSLKLILQLIDVKVGFTADDIDMMNWMNHFEVPYIIVCTKCDKLNKTQLNAAVQKIASAAFIRPNTDIVLYSSLKNIGRQQLLERILQYAI